MNKELIIGVVGCLISMPICYFLIKGTHKTLNREEEIEVQNE